MYETYKEHIEKKLADITAELLTIGYQNPETGDWEVRIDAEGLKETDENTEADAIEEWHEERAVLSSLGTTYRDCKRALEKIEQGSYGSCEICNIAITPARLEFLPTARTCVEHIDEERVLSL